MIETILAASGKNAIRNASGANLDNGLTSAFLADMRWNHISIQIILFLKLMN